MADLERYPSLGFQLVDWIEHFLVHGPGDVQGEPIDLDMEFALFLVNAYRVHGPRSQNAGRRLIRRAVLSRAKGRAKSELAGMLCCAEGIGPVRFDHWAKRGEVSYWGYEFEEGEPVGRPVTAAEVLCCATEEGQAGNTYDNVVYMLRHLKEHHDDLFPSLDPGLTRCNLPNGGVVEPVTAKARSKDGGKSTFVVWDETHLYDNVELRSMHSVIRRNLGKRKIAQPWGLETTTMFRPGADSVAERSFKFHDDLVAGKRRDEGFLFDHVEGPDVRNWLDDKDLAAAMTVAYGPAAAWMDLDRKVAEAREPDVDKADVYRYSLNRAFVGENRYFDIIRWRELVDPKRTPTGKVPVALGFDGSKNRDATVLYGWTLEDKPHGFLLGAWERPHGADHDWRIDRPAVKNTVKAAFEDFDVRIMVCDPPGWWTEIDEWRDEYGKERVVDFLTNKFKDMSDAGGRLLARIKLGDLTHDGSEVIDRHLSNCMREHKSGGAIVPVKEHDYLKIDGAIAAIIGHLGLSIAPEPVGDLEPWGFYA